ncbi:MAG TPA: ATP-binding protein [Steroidobacteraceae bacterium]|jgi:PAS domain S-box-containing protein|nr:ATP-binding protein [Steroidobacteraceae bacterium]
MQPGAVSALESVLGYAVEPPVIAAALAALLTLAGLLGASLLMRRRWGRLRRHAQAAAAHCHSLAGKLSEQRASEQTGEDQYWQHVRASAAAVIVTTSEREIVAASGQLLEMLGYRSEQELRQVRTPDLYVDVREQERLMASLKEHGDVRNTRLRLRRRDGNAIHVLGSVRIHSVVDGKSYIEGVLADITSLIETAAERQRLEGQLALAQKLQAVGELASGIAHEINTPMQFIGDNVHFLKRAFERLSSLLAQYRHRADRAFAARADGASRLPELLADVAEAFDGSIEGVERVTEIVRAMKEFAHPGDTAKASADLNQAVQTTLVVARNVYKDVANVEADFGDIPPVECRKAEINKVLLNLIVNSAHAIGTAIERGRTGRGTITIRTGRDATHVHIIVADTGCGIPQAVIARIFDPFFTTKPVGKGTGQGLAIARSIVQSHDGELNVESTVDVGTTFTIRLPLTNAADSESAAAELPPADAESMIG